MSTCCLGMRGDLSSDPIFNYEFNTTDEFIDIFNNGEYDYIFSK